MLSVENDEEMAFIFTDLMKIQNRDFQKYGNKIWLGLQKHGESWQWLDSGELVKNAYFEVGQEVCIFTNYRQRVKHLNLET